MAFVDQWTAVSAVASCFVYVFLHLALFRFSRSTQVITWLVKAFLVVACFNVVVLVFGLLLGTGGQMEAGPFILSALSSLLLCGILCFSYVVCFVGPYETSVRIRVIREVRAAGARGVSLQQLAQAYNNRLIFESRIARLMADVTSNGSSPSS